MPKEAEELQAQSGHGDFEGRVFCCCWLFAFLFLMRVVSILCSFSASQFGLEGFLMFLLWISDTRLSPKVYIIL